MHAASAGEVRYCDDDLAAGWRICRWMEDGQPTSEGSLS